MKRVAMIALCLILLGSTAALAKSYDLVLIHGLTNKHRWSVDFLDECLRTWGSGNVYCIYLNGTTNVWTRTINGRTLICIGNDDFSAGDEYIWTQASYMYNAVRILQTSYGLSSQFNIMAHSMGGLVSRYYIYAHPNTVAGLVTLGTPHHGSPLADCVNWVGYFIGASQAMDHLKVSFVNNYFNYYYPVTGSPLYSSGRIYTIRGDADGWDCFGWGGELQLGWDLLFTVYWTDSDGLVPKNSSVISGAIHVADFSSYDHMELVTKRDVAAKAALYLR